MSEAGTVKMIAGARGNAHVHCGGRRAAAPAGKHTGKCARLASTGGVARSAATSTLRYLGCGCGATAALCDTDAPGRRLVKCTHLGSGAKHRDRRRAQGEQGTGLRGQQAHGAAARTHRCLVRAGLALAHHLMIISHMAQRLWAPALAIGRTNRKKYRIFVLKKNKKLEGPWRGSCLLWEV